MEIDIMKTYCKRNLKSLAVFIPAFISVTYFSWQARDFQLDDALIYLRYIKNFQDGFGLVYNPGEKFNGLTSPLFTYIILMGSFVSRNIQSVMIFLSGFFLFFASVFAANLFSESRLGKVLISISLVSFGYFYSTFGMETALFLMLISLSLFLYERKNLGFLICLALLVITRAEGIFLALPMVLHYLYTERRLPKKRYIFFPLFIFLVPYLFNFIYYGSPFPVTGSAKIGQGESGLWGDGWIFFNIGYLVDWVFSGSLITSVLFLLFAGVGFFTLKSNSLKALSFMFVAGLVCFYGGLNIPNYHWYYAPFFFFGVCFFVKFIESSYIKLKSIPSSLLSLPLLLFTSLLYVTFIANSIQIQKRGRHETYAQVGMWLKQNTSLDASIAMVEIGTVGWYADRYIVDILGLTNKYNAEYISKGDVVSWLLHYQPDYIFVHNPIWAHEKSAHMLDEQGYYENVSDFDFDGYSLLRKRDTIKAETIKRFIKSIKNGEELLISLRESSEKSAPYIQIEGGRLFSHAPISMSASVPRNINKIEFNFGIREGAVGKHSDVCFEVVEATSEKLAFKECIEADASVDELNRKGKVQLSGNRNTELRFNITCNYHCNYAWTYWEDFQML